MSSDRTIFEERYITTDESGQTIRETARQVRKTTGEDDYIKLYVRFLGVIANLPTTANPLLNSLLRRMGYASLNKQAVILNPTEIKKICEEAKLSKTNFYRQIKLLVEYKIIFSEESIKSNNKKYPVCDTFYFNSMLFGRGAWSDIKEIRASITLNETGGRLITETSEEETITPDIIDSATGQQSLFTFDWESFNKKETKLKALKEGD